MFLLLFFTFNLQNMHVHCRKKNTSEVQPVALQEKQLSSVWVCIPWAFFSSCSETSYPHLQKHFCHGSMSDSKAGCSLHSPPCLPIKLLSSQPPLPATCLASQLSFLKLWGSGWDPDHSPRSAACRAMPREDICLPLCGCLTVPLPRSQTTLSHSLTQLS